MGSIDKPPREGQTDGRGGGSGKIRRPSLIRVETFPVQRAHASVCIRMRHWRVV